MSKAAKAVVAVVVLGGVAWAGASWYSGKRVEDEVRAYVDKVNAQSPVVTLAISDYQRGWFTSQVKYTFTAKSTLVPDMIEEGDVLAVDSQVQHGPFPFARLSRGEFAPVMAASESVLQNTGLAIQWFAAAKGQQPMRERTSVSFGGDIDSRVDFVPLSFTRDDVTLSSQAGWLTMTTDRDLTHFTMAGEFPEMRVLDGTTGGDRTALRIENTTFDGESRLGRFDAYIGDARFAVGNLFVEAGGGPMGGTNLAFRDYVIETSVSEDDTNLSLQVNYGIGNMRVMDVDLGQLQVALRLGNLNGEAVRGIVKRYQEQMPAIMAESAQPDADELPPATAAFFAESIQALLPGNPVLALDPVRVSVPGGDSSLRLNVTGQQPAEPQPNDPLAYVRTLDGSLVVSRGMVLDISKRFMELQAKAMGQAVPDADKMAEQNYAFMRQMALSSGYVVEEGDNLVVRVSYADGQARLNGDNVDLDELLAPMGINPAQQFGAEPGDDDDAFLEELERLENDAISPDAPAPRP